MARTTTTRKSTTTATPKESTTMTTKPSTAKDYKALAAKDPSTLHENFAAWLEEQTGYKVDLKTVQLVASLRHDFQRSDANQKDLAKRRAEAAKKAKAAEQAKLDKVRQQAIALGLIPADATA